jgi:hypothetical protein
MVPPPRARWRRVWPAAAACALAAAIFASRAAPVPTAPPTSPPTSPTGAPGAAPAVLLARATSLAVAPLQEELADLRRDGEQLARGLWRRMPSPLRSLVR